MSHMHDSAMTHPKIATSRYPRAMSGATPGQSFADLIAGARRAKDWSQEDLEQASGVSRSTLSRWERGLADRPEAQHVRAVCKALNIDPRKAAVSLGYLTQEEVSGGDNRLPEDLEEILAILADPAIPNAAKEEWKRYLRFLQASSRNQAAG